MKTLKVIRQLCFIDGMTISKKELLAGRELNDDAVKE